MKIVADRDIPYLKSVLEPYAEVVYCSGNEISCGDIVDADALIVRTRTRCDAALLAGSKVRFIATATIGKDHIDEAYCREAGIEVCSAPGCNARGVLQWVAAALRHVVLSDDAVPQRYKIGVVGVGNVGSLVAEYARHWGFQVLECDPPRMAREGGDFKDFKTVACECDIVTFHTPLDSTTRHMLDADMLQLMPPHAVIINASRGAVVDNRAVAHSSHRYIFDVWEGEPHVNESIVRGAELATPHVAGYSIQGKANATAAVVRGIAKSFGLPLTDWYPCGVEGVEHRLIDWREMCDTIPDYFDILSESTSFKERIEEFELLRNNYNYRREYF